MLGIWLEEFDVRDVNDLLNAFSQRSKIYLLYLRSPIAYPGTRLLPITPAVRTIPESTMS